MSDSAPLVGKRRVAAALALAALLVVSLVGVRPAEGATTRPTFSRTEYPSLGNTVAGDFNGDGRLDLAGKGFGGDLASVMLSTGPGTFGPQMDVDLNLQLQDVAAGDFDRDGRLDLAVTINNAQIGLALLEGNGDGTFQPPVLGPNETGYDSPASVFTDLNNDGNPDLVIAHSIKCYVAPCITTHLMTVMLGNGDGTFRPSIHFDVGRGMAEIAVADFNRDGFKDLAVGGDSSRLYRLYGVGDGTFVQQPTITMTADTFGVNADDLDVADFNRDGIQDIVVALGNQGSRTAVLIGNADGTFRTPLILTDPGLNIPWNLAVGDFNGDAFEDIALGFGWGLTWLMQMRNGNGDGTFQAPINMIPPGRPSAGTVGMIAAHLNGDTKMDLALQVGGAGGPTTALLLNTTAAAPTPTPSAPSLVSPSQDATVNQPVTLDWNNVSGAASYRVQVDNSSTFSAPLVVDRTVSSSQTSVSGLATTQHWWRVRAVNSAGTAGAWSTVRRFTPRATTTPPAAPSLSAVSVSPTSVVGGTSSQGRVTLTSAAPTGGFAVSLSDNSAAATVPAGVSVPAGSTSATFAIPTNAVTASTPVTVTATAGTVTRTTTLTVTPSTGSPPPTGEAATLTVTATGRSGERVTSSPTGINVAVGSSGSASFATGTSITLSATNGRDVVWSGACSSGGDKRRSCTFTINGTASVTANVQ